MIGIDERADRAGVVDGPPSTTLQQCSSFTRGYVTSGHTSLRLGRVGDDLTADDGREAAREATRRLLHSVRTTHGTLEGLRIARLGVFICTSSEFVDHGLVADAASDVIRAVFGDDLGHHARSALGMFTLPRGVAVEIEALVEVLDGS